MALVLGTRLGVYEITAEIGAGGMGIVYRAHDTTLDRDVALKVLPDAFAGDPERLARFEREAKVLASLNHPNIGAIYGLEKSGETRALVLELVEGPTLADRIAQGPIPVEEALPLARQIAEAVEAAHEQGVIHRDLKPANVKVKADGVVKVLDFGLAKALEPEASGDPSQSPTMTAAASRMGVIMGTAAYMSPEQARGISVDRRADVWAFGCVLYEMLVGQQPFRAETVTETLAAVVRDAPDWARLPGSLPPRLDRLLRRCLQKETRRRLPHIVVARLELEDAESEESPTRQASPGAAPARAGMRFTVPIPASAPLSCHGQTMIGMAKSASHIVYVANADGTSLLYRRPLESLEATPLEGTRGAQAPVLSPDGDWVAFFADGQLRKLSLTTHAMLTVCEASEDSRGACWSDDDVIVFAPTPASGLWRVSADGGKPSPLTSLKYEDGERTHRWPEMVGNEALLFTVGTAGMTSFDDARICVEVLGTGVRRVVTNGTQPRFAPTGHLVCARGGNLIAAPFDVTRLQTEGPFRPILTGVLTETTGAAHFAFSSDGLLVHAPGEVQRIERSLQLVTPGGPTEELTPIRRRFEEPRLSPDGQRLAVGIRLGHSDIWVYDLARGTLMRVTFEGDNFAPIWSADGQWITYSSNRTGASNIWRRRADGGGSDEHLIVSPYEQVPGGWSPDGTTLAFTEYHPTSGADIWLLSLDGEGAVRPAVRTAFNEYGPSFSLDGRWLAYTSDESGRDEVYVTSAEHPGAKWQVSTDGGAEPVWGRDGACLFYRNSCGVMRVPVILQSNFGAGHPELVVKGQYAPGLATGLPNYDVVDGQRLLMVSEAGAVAPPRELVASVGWFEELRRLAPRSERHV